MVQSHPTLFYFASIYSTGAFLSDKLCNEITSFCPVGTNSIAFHWLATPGFNFGLPYVAVAFYCLRLQRFAICFAWLNVQGLCNFVECLSAGIQIECSLVICDGRGNGMKPIRLRAKR